DRRRQDRGRAARLTLGRTQSGRMELPRDIRKAVDTALEGVPLSDLRRASERLSSRYRSERRDGMHLSDDLSALAYLGVRMPATYAAIRASFDAVAQLRPDFAPKTLL